MANKYAEMSLESLYALQEKNMAEKDDLRQRMIDIKTAIDEKAALREAEIAVAAMSPGQINAIAKVARAQATASAKEAADGEG